MNKNSTFSINNLCDEIFPLTYTIDKINDLEILYFTGVSMEDTIDILQERANDYLYIFNVDHILEKEGKLLSLKNILDDKKINPVKIYDDETIVIDKKELKRFLTFAQNGIELFDSNIIVDDDKFIDFYLSASSKLSKGDLYLNPNDNSSKYYINCHDNDSLYCETRDGHLKVNLLQKMLPDYFETYAFKRNNVELNLKVPSGKMINELFEKCSKLTLREYGNMFDERFISAAIFYGDFHTKLADNKKIGKLTYYINEQDWKLEIRNIDSV